MKTALITGITGQDGAYLAQLLLSKGYKVVGARRHGSSGEVPRLDKLGISQDVEIVNFDILEEASVRRIVEESRPDEIYNLAAQSSIQYGTECPQYTANTNGLGVLRLLEAVRSQTGSIRFFQASSSELFGTVTSTSQTELHPFNPRSPYGTAKLFAHHTVRNYRELYGLHASSGLMYNHTSPLQGAEFVARKITKGMARIAAGLQDKIELGSLDARRDWGHAKDFVRAMWEITQVPVPNDYIIATGVTATVREFATLAASEAGLCLKWQGNGLSEEGVVEGKVVVSVNPKFSRPAEVGILCGDAAKLKTITGWAPEFTLQDIVREMVRAEG